MRKNGFTLMEILLALGIVGVLSAVLMKVLTGVAPDVGKAKFLKAYATTRLVVSEMINDTTMYPDMDEESEMYGFANTDMPAIGLYKDSIYSGENKFINIFADKLNATPENGQFFSPRDGIIYKITAKTFSDSGPNPICSPGNGKGYQIDYYVNEGELQLGRAAVCRDGDVVCQNIEGGKQYCGTEEKPMHDLRQNQ